MTPSASHPHLVVSVINDLAGDQRIHRIACTLQEAGYQVTVIGRFLPNSKPLSKRPYETVRMKLRFHHGKVFYFAYNLRLFFLLLRLKPDILNANDLDTLLANRLIAWLRGIPLVYDSHEYFTEVPELIHRKRTRKVWLTLERWLVPKVSAMYTVNKSLAHIYQQTYQLPVQVIRNVPFARPTSTVPSRAKVLLYQGAINLGRGIDLMLRTMPHLPDYQLWIIGQGDVMADMQALHQELGLGEQVRFWGFIPFEQLADITSQAMIGLSLEEDRGLNYRYASPNKVYDYIQARIPVIVSGLPEMKALVATYQIGKVLPLDQRHPETLAAIVQSIGEDPDGYQTWVAHCEQAAQILNWQQERQNLLAIYKRVLDAT